MDNQEEALLKYLAEADLHPIEAITFCAKALEWQIAIPNIDEDEVILGMSVGTEEYLDGFFEK